jgi:hypothetical protein
LRRKGLPRPLWAAVSLLLLIALPWIVWMIQEERSLVVTIYDKTVPDTSYREHKGLMWLLNHRKLTKAEGGKFNYEQDYYGFHPQADRQYEVRPLPDAQGLASTDLLYMTDAYGVYEEEFFGHHPDGNRSKSLYGGVTKEDVAAFRAFLSSKKPVSFIAEFNAFGSPTTDPEREQLYELLRVRWSGWMGRYIPDLKPGGEVPNWAIASYERKHGGKWGFEGPGFLFVGEQDDIVVLEMGKDIGAAGSRYVWTEEGSKLTGLSGSHYYNYWFDITEPMSGGKVLAEYSLDATEAGARKLAEQGIPLRFPAVVRSAFGANATYYFAGDYADHSAVPNYYHYAGLSKLKRWFTRDTLGNENSFFWHSYVGLMDGILADAEQRKSSHNPAAASAPDVSQGAKLVSRTQGRMLQTFTGDTWSDMFVKGVNLGAALPGKWFTEFPQDEATYYRWLEGMGELNANSIRVYTLLPPPFYRALERYNGLHPERKIWLLQEIWPEENPENHNYLSTAYMTEYRLEMERVIDAIHGQASIPPRQGRAYGEYRSDVSSYVLGYLVGRELEPEEVKATDKLNPGYSFQGDYLTTSGASPTEAWLAASADYALTYEEKKYGWQHPVAVVNWPTLDPIEHTSEWNEQGMKSQEFNDSATVDIRHLKHGPKMKAGLFGAYHIYPNYPDFMNNEVAYDAYHDEEGRLRYGGYLQEFMRMHQEYPALVAEFGLATGMGNAHSNPDGYNHGGMTEEQQGQGIVRMLKAIRREGYAGGVVFEWLDEWAKKTWVTEPYMIPYDRHVLWHNAIDPEQNYGLVAMESVKPTVPGAIAEAKQGIVQRAELRSDASYLYIDLKLQEPFDPAKHELRIGLDTYDRVRGEHKYAPTRPETAPSGMEFQLVLSGTDTGMLQVIPSYNMTAGRYASQAAEEGHFEVMRTEIQKKRVRQDGSRIEAQYEESSKLKFGPLTNSANHWHSEGNRVSVRIPWGRLLVSDPTQGTVIDDPRSFNVSLGRDMLRTVRSEGIAVSILALDRDGALLGSLPEQGNRAPWTIPWKTWSQPTYQERYKDGFHTIGQYFQSLR